ncbi:uncharacterized protein LOC136032686 [Artemia franciscana]|uniref:aralkylamine N-acetyltransferase n=1 Tax=Artemia franciscana TaxID=6661 RepID=A0AA88IAF6_ARTSF|nr:hypothetical protein QYM36_001085 [Artemia franciscana]
MENTAEFFIKNKRVQLLHLDSKASLSFENNDPSLKLVILNEEEADEVSDHLLENFFPFEPLAMHLQLNLEDEIRPWLRSLISHQLSQGLSVGLRDQLNENLLVGVSVNEDVTRNQNEITMKSCITEDYSKMKQIIHMINLLYDSEDMLDVLEVERAIHICMVSVKQEYGGQGIAKRLLEHTETLAADKGIIAFFAEATGNYSAAAFIKKGFKIFKELPYKEYEFNGEKPFGDMKKHNALRLVTKKLKI